MGMSRIEPERDPVLLAKAKAKAQAAELLRLFPREKKAEAE